MIFGKTKNIDKSQIKITIEGQILEIVTKTKFLGLILDDHLSWKEHSLYLAQKMAKSIGILSIARQVLSRTTLIQLYYSFIFPYLSYCNLAWGGAADTNLWVVYRIQKMAIRMILNIKKGSSTKDECKSLLILRLPEIHLNAVAIFMFKFYHNMLPSLFDNFFTCNRDMHSYNTRNAKKLRTPLVKTSLAGKFIKKTGVMLWNKLDNVMNVDCKIGTFKKYLKTYLTQDY
jgi:hypothetical protein